jgi:DNA-directed RNA polymerase specialized sigma24 family protein
LQELNTRDFLGRLKSGDAVAFQTLYSILRPKLCDFIVRLFEIEIGVAEELASDALVKVHCGVKRFDPDGGAKLTTWIFKVAQNTALDHLRKQSKSAPADPFDKVVSQRLEKESTQEMFTERNRELTGGAASEGDRVGQRAAFCSGHQARCRQGIPPCATAASACIARSVAGAGVLRNHPLKFLQGELNLTLHRSVVTRMERAPRGARSLIAANTRSLPLQHRPALRNRSRAWSDCMSPRPAYGRACDLCSFECSP